MPPDTVGIGLDIFKNLLLFLVALVVIVIGHVSLGMGSITFAPVCLVAGYCVLVPLAIII